MVWDKQNNVPVPSENLLDGMIQNATENADSIQANPLDPLGGSSRLCYTGDALAHC